MSKMKNGFWLLAISIVCAVAILVSSYVFAGKEYTDEITFGLIAVWWIPFSILIGGNHKCCR